MASDSSFDGVSKVDPQELENALNQARKEIAGRFDLSPPAVSQHLKTLRDAKMVSVRTDKQRRIYELNPEGVKELTDWIARIRAFWNPKLDALEEALKKDAGK